MTFAEFRDLIRRDPGHWPLPVRLGAIGVFFVVMTGVLLYVGVWIQKKDELAQKQNEEETLRQEFRTKHSKAVNLDQYKQQLTQIESDFGIMLRQLPGKTQVDRVLTDISLTAASVGLRTEYWNPMAEEIKDFYAVVPIQIRFRGTYHQIGDFVSGVAALYRIVTLHDMTIKSIAKDAAAGEMLQIELTARTYRYLEDSEIAAAEAAKKAATARGGASS